MSLEIAPPPGSITKFAERVGVDIDSLSTVESYTQALGEYRSAIARHLGLTLTELHEGGKAREAGVPPIERGLNASI